MLMLSKKVEYGLIALLHMAWMRRDELVTAKEISDRYSIPAELMGKVLQTLAKANLVDAVHGAKGGYHLTRNIEEITLGDMIEALEGPVHLVRCQEDPSQCGQFHTCNIKEPVMQIHEKLQQYIHGISLAALTKPARQMAEAKT
jgi:Rrf2 family protein